MSTNYRRRALSPEEDERVREAVRRLVVEFGSQARLSERLSDDPGQQTISKHLAGTPAGMHFAERIAGAMRIPVEVLLGRPVATTKDAPTFDRIPGYDEAERIARLANPRIPDDVWQAVRGIRGAALQYPTPAGLAAAAQLVIETRAPRTGPGDGVREYPDDGDVPPPVKPRRR